MYESQSSLHNPSQVFMNSVQTNLLSIWTSYAFVLDHPRNIIRRQRRRGLFGWRHFDHVGVWQTQKPSPAKCDYLGTGRQWWTGRWRGPYRPNDGGFAGAGDGDGGGDCTGGGYRVWPQLREYVRRNEHEEAGAWQPQPEPYQKSGSQHCQQVLDSKEISTGVLWIIRIAEKLYIYSITCW